METKEDKRMEYALKMSKPEDALLASLNRDTHIKMMNPRMISGHFQGKLLEMISRMLKPRRVLEIGTFTGYSAICLSAGLQPGGELITLERNPEMEPMAKDYFLRAGLENKVRMILGDALELIPQLDEIFDLVYIDCDKAVYPDIYCLVRTKVRPGSVILADNVLWNDKVLNPGTNPDGDTRSVIRFNETIKNDEGADNLLLPLRDGLMMIMIR